MSFPDNIRHYIEKQIVPSNNKFCLCRVLDPNFNDKIRVMSLDDNFSFERLNFYAGDIVTIYVGQSKFQAVINKIENDICLLSGARISQLRGGSVVKIESPSNEILFENLLGVFNKVFYKDPPNEHIKILGKLFYLLYNGSLAIENDRIILGSDDYINAPKYYEPKFYPESIDGKEKVKEEKQQDKVVGKAIGLLKDPKSLFLICWGPPGTGKTTTIAKILKQYIEEGEGKRVLVTSFTNVAVDNVFQKFIEIYPQDKKWLLRYAEDHCVRIPEIREFSLTKKIKGTRSNIVDEIKEFKIVGATLDKLGFLPSDTEEETGYDLAIIDECSMVEFPKALYALTRAKKFILVGDPRQLTPFIGSEEKRKLEIDIDEETELTESLSFFNKLIEPFEKEVKTNENFCVMLKTQYRCFDDIIRYSINNFYPPNTLKTYDRLDQEREKEISEFESALNKNCSNKFIREVLDPNKHMVWLNTKELKRHDGKESFNEPRKWYRDHSLGNVGQASVVVILLKEILRILKYIYKNDKTAYRSKIGIITPFRFQNEIIKNYLYEFAHEIDPYLMEHASKANTFNLKSVTEDSFYFIELLDLLDKLEINTVEKYQGREKDIIIFNLVFHSIIPFRNAKAIFNDKNKLNVALTRAKNKLIIVGTYPVKDRDDHFHIYNNLYNFTYQIIDKDINKSLPIHYIKVLQNINKKRQDIQTGINESGVIEKLDSKKQKTKESFKEFIGNLIKFIGAKEDSGNELEEMIINKINLISNDLFINKPFESDTIEEQKNELMRFIEYLKSHHNELIGDSVDALVKRGKFYENKLNNEKKAHQCFEEALKKIDIEKGTRKEYIELLKKLSLYYKSTNVKKATDYIQSYLYFYPEDLESMELLDELSLREQETQGKPNLISNFCKSIMKKDMSKIGIWLEMEKQMFFQRMKIPSPNNKQIFRELGMLLGKSEEEMQKLYNLSKKYKRKRSRRW